MTQNSPALWRYLLEQYPRRGVLMGGAVIDFLCDKPAKDYDIFVPYNWLDEQPKVLPNWVAEPLPDALDEIYYEQGEPVKIGRVDNYTVDKKYKVQIIHVLYKDPREYFKSFDHSLTLGMYTRRGLIIDDRALESFETHVIKYVAPDFNGAKGAKAFVRAQAKAAKYGWKDAKYVGFGEMLN